MSSRHHVRRTLAHRIRAASVAPLLAITLACAGVTLADSAASAAAFSELDLTWTDPPSSVGNGDLLRGVAHVNLNDTLGEEGIDANHLVRLSATGGLFTRLPSACRTDGVPTSSVSADASSVECNLGQVRYGTAVEVDFSVVAHAGDGDAVSVDISDGSVKASVPPVPVSATPGIDVVFNEAQKVQANAAWHATFPISVALPAGAADLSGPIAFDVLVTDKTSSNAPGEIQPHDSACVPLDSVVRPSSMPPTSPAAPVPATCRVTRTAPGTLHVVLDGYRTPAAVDAPSQAADGSSLPTDRHFFAAFGLALESPNGVDPATSSFDLTVARVTASSAAGTAVRETDTTNNTESVAITVPGGWATDWANPRASTAPLDSRVVGGGSPWSATYYAAPGDQIVSQSTSGWWGGQRAADIPPGADWSTCVTLDGAGAFDGVVMPSIESTNAVAVASLPAGSYRWSVYTGALPASGRRDSFDCGAVTFTAVTSTAVNQSGGPCGCVQEERLSVSDPATIRALMLTVDPVAVAKASALGVTPPRIGLHAGVRISASATAADAVWTLGSAMDRSGGWRTGASTPTTISPTPGSLYPSTNALRDIMRVIGARPYVDKTVSQPSVRAGDEVTYSIRTGAEANLGTGDASWTLTDTLPGGVDYVDDSASFKPAAVDRRPDGTTVLTWPMSGAVNTDTVITYRARIAFTSGVRRNTAVASIATGPGSPTPSVQTDEDSADVVYAGDGRTLLTKSSGSPTFAAGGANTWTLDLANLDTVEQTVTDIIDVLPWNGDARGSHFHGGYAIDSVTRSDGDRVYYATAAPATLETDPNAPANGSFGAPSALWSSTMPHDHATITAIRIVGGALPVAASKQTTITWHTVDGRPGDAFQNIAWAKASHTRLQMIKAAATTTVADGSALQIAKSFSSASGWADGDRLTYVITAHNPSSSAAHQVRVHDLGGHGSDPATVEFTDMTVGSFNTQDRTWDIGDLAPGATVTARVTTAIPVGTDTRTPLTNRVIIENPSNPHEADDGGDCQRNNQDVRADTDQCDLTEVAPPRLKIDKHVDHVATDGTITWSIRVRVDGSVAARDVVVEDTWPDGIDPSSIKQTRAPSQGSFDPQGARWAIGTLQPGAVATLTFSAKVATQPGATIVNIASVDSPDVTPPGSGPTDPPCQINDGPTIDAALDADTDQCDRVETTVPGPASQPVPRTQPPHRVLPETGGPQAWVGLLGGASGIGGIAMVLFGRRPQPVRGAHRG